MSIGLITSAAYINQEMAAEFGPLPPAFLPLGHGRLFLLQAELLRPLVDRIVLSLPQSFRILPDDARLLESLEIAVIRIPDALPLAESMMLALMQSLLADEQLYILHGDTLLAGLTHFPSDGLSVHAGSHPYPWARLEGCDPTRLSPADDAESDGATLVSGMFGFSSGLDFLRCLGEARSDFLTALNLYAVSHPQFRAVDDCGQWLDLGHLNTYYASRRAFTTERAFNNLSISRDAVCKTSLQAEKMEAEARWFEDLPSPLRGHVPAYLGRVAVGCNRAGYHLSYEYLSALSDLYVFGALAPEMWRQILGGCADVLARMREYKPEKIATEWFPALYGAKTIARLNLFAEQSGVDPARPWTLNGVELPAPLVLAEEMDAVIGPPSAEDAGVLHGDFCFSNILYDFRRGAIKLVDPRGYVEPGRPGIFGDTRYDIGKLHHSVIGQYDFIMAGYFGLEDAGPQTLTFSVGSSPNQDAAEREFRSRICGGDPARERVAGAISVLLHLSMLPLHADAPRRQKALLANGYRLYQRYFAEAA